MWYLLLLILIVILGLASRKYPLFFPSVSGKYPGDALWTIAVYLLCCIILPKTPSYKIAGIALLISFLDEISQLYQAPWINEIRRTYPGHVILGSGFSMADLVAYTVGAALAYIAEQGAFFLRSRGGYR
jgi:hypothetical protein